GSLQAGSMRWLPRRGRRCRSFTGEGCRVSAQEPAAFITTGAETVFTSPVSASRSLTPETAPSGSQQISSTLI
ncbi:MAG: hypothetical protein R6U97_04780, partial [Desulfosalsimonas sp.]